MTYRDMPVIFFAATLVLAPVMAVLFPSIAIECLLSGTTALFFFFYLGDITFREVTFVITYVVLSSLIYAFVAVHANPGT